MLWYNYALYVCIEEMFQFGCYRDMITSYLIYMWYEFIEKTGHNISPECPRIYAKGLSKSA